MRGPEGCGAGRTAEDACAAEGGEDREDERLWLQPGARESLRFQERIRTLLWRLRWERTGLQRGLGPLSHL